MPHWANQSASARRSVVKAPNSRTETSSRPSGTATQWRSEPMSIPAAFKLTCCKCAGRSFTWNFFVLFLRCDMLGLRYWGDCCRRRVRILAIFLTGSHHSKNERYVTSGIHADPETKLRNGQNAPLSDRPSRPATGEIIQRHSPARPSHSFTMVYARLSERRNSERSCLWSCESGL